MHRFGVAFVDFFAHLGYAARLTGEAVWLSLFGRRIGQPVRAHQISAELIAAGLSALPVVCLMSATIGVMLTIQGIDTLRIFGAESRVIYGIGISMPQEFAPLITGIIVAGRSGSALTSRVGSMQLNGEVDALTVMGIAPARFIVAPPLIALFISLPVLVACANLVGLAAAGVYIDLLLGIGPEAYWPEIIETVSVDDYLFGLTKACVFAVLIALISISTGMRVAGGAEVLGRATTSSVVACICSILVADAVFAIAR